MQHTLHAMLASGLVFGLVSCGETTETTELPDENPPTHAATPEEDSSEDTSNPEEPAPENPAEETAVASDSSNMGEFAKQVSDSLVTYDAGSDGFVKAQLDGSIEYYLVSLSASW